MKPRISEPVRLTVIVAHGKPAECGATTVQTQYLAMLPMAPPPPTRRNARIGRSLPAGPAVTADATQCRRNATAGLQSRPV